MSTKGIWASATQFKEFANDKASLVSEIATWQRRNDFWSITQFLPNPDPVLKKQGKDITAYQELLTDAHLGGCVDTRKANTQSLEWDIDRGKAKSRQAKLVKEVFERLDVNRIIDEILDAVLFGYQPMEILWEERDGWIVPRDIVGKAQEWFHCDANRHWRFRTADSYEGIEVPDTQIFIVQHQPRYMNQYGFPVLSRCFWPVVFKKGGVKFWVTFAEKYGMPHTSAKYPDAWVGNQTQIDDFFKNVDSMVQDALIVLPHSSDVTVTPTGGTASAEIFSGIKNWANEEMSKAVFGHGAAADSTPGKLGNEAGATNSADAKKGSDKKMIAAAFNHVIRKMTSINFGDTVIPPRFVMFEEEDVDLALAQRDATLRGIGVLPTASYVQRVYGFEEGDFTLEHAPPDEEIPPTEFAEAGGRTAEQKAIDAMVDDVDVDELSKSMMPTILDEVKSCSSYAEAKVKVLSMFGKVGMDPVREKLFKVMYNAALAGALAVDNEADE